MRCTGTSFWAVILLVLALLLGGCATADKTMINATLEKATKLRLEAESSPNVGLVQNELKDSRQKQHLAENYVQQSVSQPLLALDNKKKLIDQAKTAAEDSLTAAKKARDKAANPPVVVQPPQEPTRKEQPAQEPKVVSQDLPKAKPEAQPSPPPEPLPKPVPRELPKPAPRPLVKPTPQPLPKPVSKPTSVIKHGRAVPEQSPAEAYARALADYNRGRFPRSRQEFSDFLALYPSHKLAPNAQYWLAETYYSEGNWSQALNSFQGVLNNYPGSRKEADALCKIGLTQRNMGQLDQARSSLKRCIDHFPKSHAAQVSRRALDRLG